MLCLRWTIADVDMWRRQGKPCELSVALLHQSKTKLGRRSLEYREIHTRHCTMFTSAISSGLKCHSNQT